MPWFAINTKPRNELKVCEKLQSIGVNAYAPSYVEIRQWSDRKKKLRVPYFPSYVFVNLDERNRNVVFCHPAVLRYVFWQGKPAIIRDSELEMIKEYLDGREKQDVMVERFRVGDLVVLMRGALKNTQAYVEQLNSVRARLVLPALGYKITVRTTDLAPMRSSA
jgi:transcription antitermination factor NusG